MLNVSPILGGDWLLDEHPRNGFSGNLPRRDPLREFTKTQVRVDSCLTSAPTRKQSERDGDQAGGHAACVPLESAKRCRERVWGGLETPEDLTQTGSASHFEIAWSTASNSAPMSRSGLRSSDTQYDRILV
jgi:hypothetical protein